MSKLDKALGWVKKYWYLLLIAGSGLAIVIASIVFRGKSKALVEAFMKNREGMLKQVKKIDQLNEEANKKKNQAIKDHVKERDLLDKAFVEKIETVEKEREERVEELAKGDSQDLADALKKGFKL